MSSSSATLLPRSAPGLTAPGFGMLEDGLGQFHSARLSVFDSNQYQQQQYDLARNYNNYLDNNHQMGFRIHYGAVQ